MVRGLARVAKRWVADVVCKARQIEQAIEANTAPTLQPSNGRDGFVGMQEGKLAGLINLAHQAHQFMVAIPEARFVDRTRDDQSQLSPVPHPSGGAGEFDRFRFVQRFVHDAKCCQ